MTGSPKSPANRHHLYKNAGRTAAHLRESLRKQVAERLRDGRFIRQNARRNLDFGANIAQAIKDELADAMEGASFEEQLAMFEELQAEIQQEFEEYEAMLAHEEEALAGHLESDAFCPKCKRNPMDVDNTGCLCKVCGFGYAFPSGSSLNKEELSGRLFAGFNGHSDAGCDKLPDPVVLLEGLFLRCGHCDYSTKVA